MTPPFDRIAADGELIRFESRGQDWEVAWYSPETGTPSGKRHGSSAVCVTGDTRVVLVTEDGEHWGLPGGRPECSESWRETLDREVMEEACARVQDATLLGFTQGKCTHGHELGLVLVRAIWRATVSLDEWAPRYEMKQRLVLPPSKALDRISLVDSPKPIHARTFHEAHL
jgi:ADP-ribose pyrophosphatase YjhB (NUDIX family)